MRAAARMKTLRPEGIVPSDLIVTGSPSSDSNSDPLYSILFDQRSSRARYPTRRGVADEELDVGDVLETVVVAAHRFDLLAEDILRNAARHAHAGVILPLLTIGSPTNRR